MQAFAGWAEVDGGADRSEAYPKGVASGECQVESGRRGRVEEWGVERGLRIDIKAKSQNPKPKSFVFIVISMRNIASASTMGCGGCTGRRGCGERVGFNQR